MTPNDITRSSLLDLLFEHRNKQYGAYVLRKYYDNRLSLSIGIMLLAVLLTLVLLQVLGARPGAGEPLLGKATELILQKAPTTTQPKVPEPPKAHPAGRQVAAIKSTNQIEFTRDQNTVPDLHALAGNAIGTTTVAGATPGDGPTPPGTGTAPEVQSTPPPPAPAPEVELPSAPPSFPGGMKAWADYLSRNLQPSSDMQPGEKRSVLVRFWVGEDGVVGRFEVLQSGGPAFDNEVIRVLKRMPNWKPALQRGHAVATSFVQPVTFQAPEE